MDDADMSIYNEPNHREKSALSDACSDGNLEQVRDLLQQGAHVHLKGPSKEQPIIKALQCKKESRKEIIKLLIRYGEDLNFSLGFPMQTAILDNDVEGVELLIFLGAQLNFEQQSSWYYNEHYCIPFMEGIFDGMFGDNHLEEWYIHKEMKLDKVKAKMRILKLLLESGLDMDYYVDTDLEDNGIRHGLHTACYARDYRVRPPVEMIELILWYGADVHKELDGDTAFKIACQNVDLETIKLLVCYGANVNTVNQEILACRKY